MIESSLSILSFDEAQPDFSSQDSMIRIRDAVEGMTEYVLTHSPEASTMLQHYDSLSPIGITPSKMLAELGWVVYSSGFRYDVVRKYWKAICRAFNGFEVRYVASLYENIESEAERICCASGFKNKKKAMWCIHNARRIIELNFERKEMGGIGGYWAELSRKNTYDLIHLAPLLVDEFQFKGIGNTTIFHLMKNLGIDIFKPDRHVRRALVMLGLIRAEEVPIHEICRAMLTLSQASQRRIIELDTLIFEYGRMTKDSDVLKANAISAKLG